jgi:hypothetical protein
MTDATEAQRVMKRLPGLITHLSHRSRISSLPRRNTSGTRSHQNAQCFTDSRHVHGETTNARLSVNASYLLEQLCISIVTCVTYLCTWEQTEVKLSSTLFASSDTPQHGDERLPTNCIKSLNIYQEAIHTSSTHTYPETHVYTAFPFSNPKPTFASQQQR